MKFFLYVNYSLYFCIALNTMERVSFAIVTAAVGMAMMTSCTKYNIQGSSDLQNADGRMLYLKDVVDEEIVNLDSCDMVHGKFSFHGALDSVRIVTLCINEQPVLPVVLEDGDITVTLNMQKQTCTGTPMNDTLNIFNTRYRKLAEQLEDLSHQQSQAIMNGENMDTVNRRLAQKEEQLMIQEDRLVTSFITENFDNCLGPYIFRIATGGYEFPIFTPWIEALMTKATERFKNDPYVKEYMDAATHNRDVMTGVAPPQQQQMPSLPTLPKAPTPNELAGE